MKTKIEIRSGQKVKIKKGSYAIQTNFFFDNPKLEGEVLEVFERTAYVRLNQEIIINSLRVWEATFDISDLEVIG